jgi:hypothetical protein
MKKILTKKMSLSRESLLVIGNEIEQVAGGAQAEIHISRSTYTCDSVCSCSDIP